MFKIFCLISSIFVGGNLLFAEQTVMSDKNKCPLDVDLDAFFSGFETRIPKDNFYEFDYTDSDGKVYLIQVSENSNKKLEIVLKKYKEYKKYREEVRLTRKQLLYGAWSIASNGILHNRCAYQIRDRANQAIKDLPAWGLSAIQK